MIQYDLLDLPKAFDMIDHDNLERYDIRGVLHPTEFIIICLSLFILTIKNHKYDQLNVVFHRNLFLAHSYLLFTSIKLFSFLKKWN